MGEREVPFEICDPALQSLGEGEHTVPMRVRDDDGNVIATLGDVTVNVTRNEHGWVWDARIPGEIDPGVAEHLGVGRFSFVIPDLAAPEPTAEGLAELAADAVRRFRGY